ncbi:interferon alpha/beta receptor 2-like isoform X2 [Pagrus major]|uniref:interferon alpha/beta receptor 2-like isoform X2 n=1 Tax=Pagrus major TaxID=143350 RepID=UPI003CC8DA0C
MGLWILLVLLLQQLHLGNAPWTEVSVSLPAPSNVSISSFNMEHMLSFLPGPDTPDSSRFAVEVLRPSRKSWRAVAGCSELTAGQTCNLTRVFKEPSDRYTARVQAFTAGQKSDWTESAAFQPLLDTVLGPPDVSVSGCGNCLLLQVRPPSVGMLLMDHYIDLVFEVKRTRDGAQFSLTRQYQEEMVISYLQSGVEYCVTVTVKTLFNDKSVPSDPYCAFTSPPEPAHSLSVVYGLLGAFCALGFVLIGSVVYGGQLSFRLLRRRLLTTMSYFLLKVQDGGAAPPGLSGDTLSTLLHKEGSADCLLTDHRPVQTLRSSSEED